MNVIAKHIDLPVAVIGDIHDKFEVITNKIRQYQLSDAILFQAGDFGVGFNYNNPVIPRKENKRLKDLNNKLFKERIFLYVVRGNHDNPMFYDGKHNLTNIVFMQDYDIVEVGDFSYLGIGGATSVDRKRNNLIKDYRGKDYPGRREGVDWWPGAEKIVYDEDKLATIAGVDVVITHTCPDFAYPPTKSEGLNKWFACDPELEGELIEERIVTTKIYNKLNEMNCIKFWYYGHFHQTKKEKHGVTEFCLLDVDEFREVKIFKEDE